MNLCKEEELTILRLLLGIETLRNNCERMIDAKSLIVSDFEQYLKMAMKIDPNDPDVLERWTGGKISTVMLRNVHGYNWVHLQIYLSFGFHQKVKQQHIDPTEQDYGYINTFRKAMIVQPDPRRKEIMSNILKWQESKRDYFTASLRPIKHLIQIDQKPNMELEEPRWELYKVSISFQPIRKFDRIEN